MRPEMALLAVVADRLGVLIWMLSDSSGKTDPPPSILETLTGKREISAGFDSGEDFAAAWALLTGGKEDV